MFTSGSTDDCHSQGGFKPDEPSFPVVLAEEMRALEGRWSASDRGGGGAGGEADEELHAAIINMFDKMSKGEGERKMRRMREKMPNQRAMSALDVYVERYGPTVNNLTSL